jgi:hypothetical protein
MNLKLLKQNIKKLLLEAANQKKSFDLINQMIIINDTIDEKVKNILGIDQLNEKLRLCLFADLDTSYNNVFFALIIYKNDTQLQNNSEIEKDLVSLCPNWTKVSVKDSIRRIVNQYLINYKPSYDKSKNKEILSYYKILEKEIVNVIEPLVPWGSIAFGDNENVGYCLEAYSIIETRNTKKGWGPLLYDIAIIISSKIAYGLMPDRREVSDDAYNIWKNYFENRPDVSKLQLDIDISQSYLRKYKLEKPLEQLTPDNKMDDCEMESTFDHLGQNNDYRYDRETLEKWKESPLSKVYYNNNFDIIDKLKSNFMIYTKRNF